MKTIKLLILVLLLFCVSKTRAAEIKHALKSDLYATNNVFAYSKLMLEVKDYDKPKSKKRLDSLRVFKNEKKHYSSQKDGNGFITYKNTNYRIYKNIPYKIVDTAGFYIYYRYKNEAATNGKGAIKTDEYFFSTKGDTDIQPFTIENLKEAYPEKNQFHYDIDALFKLDKDLLIYDNIMHVYKIKYLFLHSVL